MNTSKVYFSSGAAGNYSVRIEGLESLLKFLETVDPKMKRAFQKGLKEAAQPVLQKARANASKIADDGTYGSSLSIASRKSGAEIVLKSTDEAAGVKEFAHLGARYVPKPTDKRINARKMRSFRVGVPRRAYAPRVMVPAVNDSVDEVLDAIDERLAEVLDEVEHG